jgi:hypothetical protein
MKEYIFTELGFFTVSQCEKLKQQLEGKTFMKFKIKWSNQAGNCTLIIATDYDETEQEIKNFFLSFALYQLAMLIK